MQINRALDRSHVQRLQQSFDTSLRAYDVDDRMKGVLSTELFDALCVMAIEKYNDTPRTAHA